MLIQLFQNIEQSTPKLRFETTSNTTIVRAIMRGPNPPSVEQVSIMENGLPTPPDGTRVELRIRFVQTTIIDRNGMLYWDVNFSTMGG
ncbi:MAG TPA: hypothetical protein VF360_01565 [Candidatus Methanoperedens sp.]